MTQWKTQQAVVVLPASTVTRDRRTIKVKTKLTIASVRILPNVVKWYRCHMLGHNVARCTVVSTGKVLCRRCGERGHTINQCTKEPRCAICLKENRNILRHITGSLEYPTVKEGMKRGNPSRG